MVRTSPSRVSLTPIVHEGKSLLHCVWRDITAIKQTEEAIAKSNQRMKLAADAAGFGVWDLDLVTNHLEWDDWMFQFYGVQAEDFQGTYEAWQARVHPDDLNAASREVELAIETGEAFRCRVSRCPTQWRQSESSKPTLSSSGIPEDVRSG